MPEFIPLAGFSPSCWAVLVQIEHCAVAISVKSNAKQIISKYSTNLFFITAIFGTKLQQNILKKVDKNQEPQVICLSLLP